MITRRVSRAVLSVVAAGFFASCGIDQPAAPEGPPPPTADIDWEAVERLLGDPLYLGLPGHLANPSGAQPIESAVRGLAAALRKRDLAALRSWLARIELAREKYTARPAFLPSDTVILWTMDHFESRARVYLGEEPARSGAGSLHAPRG